MTLNITEPTVGASSGTWGTQLNDALTAIVAYVNTVESNAQPVDSDLTAIAALTTTAYGRSLLTQANAAAAQTVLGLGTAATQASSAFDAAGAAATAQATALSGAATDATAKANAAAAASQPLDSDLTAIAALTTTAFGRSFLDRADATAARTLLGLGTLATQSGTFSGTSSGTNTGDQTIPVTTVFGRTGAVSLTKADVTGTGLTASDVGAQPAGNYVSASPAPSAWQASHAYTVGQTFTQGGTTYVVATAYTSAGTFGSTDTTNTFTLGGGAKSDLSNLALGVPPADGLAITYDGSAGAYKPRATLQGLRIAPGFVPAYTRAQPPYAYSDTAQQQGQSRIRHVPLFPTNSIRLVYANWTVQTGTTGLSTITVRAGIEDPYGGVVGVTFNGQRTVIIDPGGIAISDPIQVDNPGPTGSFPYYWSRTLVTVATAGQRFPTLTTAMQGNAALSGDSYEYGAALTDKTTATGALTTTGYNSNVYGPSLILADAPGRRPPVFVYGDSIAAGQGDTNATTGMVGYTSRALYAAGLPFIVAGNPSEQALAAFMNVGTQSRALPNSNGIAYKMQWMAGCAHIIAAHGVNDINPSLGNKSLSAFQTLMLAYWACCANRGAKVWAPTLTPHTTSTDSWATTGNQTINNSTENTARTSFNDWLRAGAPIDSTTKAAVAIGTSGALVAGVYGHPLAGYFEIADLAETSRNSGIWKAGYTQDGIHPNSTASPALAGGIDTSLLAA